MPTTNIEDARALLKRAKRLVGVANQWRDSAEKVIYWAKCSVDDPGGSSYNDSALALVDRCFKVNEHKSDSKKHDDLDSIKNCFRSIAAFYTPVLAGKGYLTVGPPIRAGDIAYAQVNGWKTGDKNGLTFVIEKCKVKGDEKLTDIIMHESVHFAGGIDHYILGGAPAYGEKVFLLTNSQAMVNASSYSYLAYLARMPQTSWLTAV